MSNYHDWNEEVANKLNTTLFERYLENCKTIIFTKISNHKKCKWTKVPSYLHIVCLSFDRANHSFINPSVLGETDFQKILPGVLSGGLGHE